MGVRGSIGDAEDELGRFLGVLRFWFTKDLVSGDSGGGGRRGLMVAEIHKRQTVQGGCCSGVVCGVEGS